ncbi:MAG: hypothetical protein ACRCXL_12780 [Dermatophilaceae bacterium]
MMVRLEKDEWEIGDQLAADPGGFGSVRHASGAMCQDAVAKLVPKEPGANRELRSARTLAPRLTSR